MVLKDDVDATSQLQSFQQARATMAATHGVKFAQARDMIFQNMVDSIIAHAVAYMKDVIDQASANSLGGDLEEVAIEAETIPQSLAHSLAQDFARSMCRQLLVHLESFYPASGSNWIYLVGI